MSDNLDLSKVDEIHEERETYKLTTEKTVPEKEPFINKNMLISETIEQYPELLDVFMENGLHCVGCAFSPFDTIDTGGKTHGWEDEKIDAFVAQLNEAISGESCCGGDCGCGHNEERESCCGGQC